MLNERKTNTLEFALTEYSSSETSGGESSASSRTVRNVEHKNVSLCENVKTLRINSNRVSSPTPLNQQRNRPQSHQILKSKSGQSIKDFERQET